MLGKPRRQAMQEINSSSMSDIAFLLLVFFLVTTTISMDKGISLILPAEGNELEVNRKNIISILVNDKGKVLMDDNPTKINQIKTKASKRISSNPNIIFSITTHKNTNYDDYILVLDQLKQANDVLRYLETFGDDPLGKLDDTKKDEFLKQLIPTSSSIKSKELSKKIPEDVSSVSGVTQSGNAGNVAVLPMGKNSNETLVRNDTGGLSSGPSMKLHPNFDIDNFVAPINMASFNIV